MLRHNAAPCFLTLLLVLSLQARIIHIGPSHGVKTIAEAAAGVQHGDTVQIDKGVYNDVACTWRANNLVIRGTATFAHLKAPAVIANRKAIFVIQGENTLIENVEFSGASVPDKNGAGIRLEGKNVTIRNCYFHHCEDGILGGKGSVVVEYSEFAYCGFGDGYSHNMYIAACDSFMLRFCYTHDVSEGHTIKSRALQNYILYNRIESANSTASYEVNLPNGGTSYIIGNQIQQGAHSHNAVIIDYGSEGVAEHDTALFIVNNTIVNDRGSGTFISVRNTKSAPKVFNNIFTGGGTVCNVPMDSAGNYIGSTPGFVNKEQFDYHLTQYSPARTRGVDPGMGGEFSLMPVYEYIDGGGAVPRRGRNQPLDAGAYGYSDVHVTLYPLCGNKQMQVVPSYWCDLRGRLMPRRHLGVGDPENWSKKGWLDDFRVLVYRK